MQGSIFWVKNDIYSPPPSENYIFSPSRDTSFLDSHRGLFALILPYFAFILPFFFPFSHFLPLSSFFFPLSSFFFYIFPLFLLPFSYIFPQMTLADTSPPPPRGRGYFPIYRPLTAWEISVPGQDQLGPATFGLPGSGVVKKNLRIRIRPILQNIMVTN